MQSAARDSGKNGVITCLAPDVCKTQVGNAVVPIPYMIISKLEWSKQTVSKIEMTGLKAFNMNSRTDKVTGDEPGKLGGVKSGVNQGWCRPQSNKSSVFVDGAQLLQNNNLYEMNCAGPNGPGNTVGRLTYFD
ncbi:protein of unknown function [Cognatiyoonia koreensis]|uniref:Uncharacterized protein n=1 Tax=Cognatiyoonia koreensis TaxID=364200 RepID=A0A1I0RSD2_9RHOB|nr:DUF4150 domain-containing protein [Cognatiyoonia koreensis]SEW44102.1 protein of unknown function [Cognatiyoonia koreensis]